MNRQMTIFPEPEEMGIKIRITRRGMTNRIIERMLDHCPCCGAYSGSRESFAYNDDKTIDYYEYACNWCTARWVVYQEDIDDFENKLKQKKQ